MGKARRNPDPFVEFPIRSCGHVVRDDLPARRRSLADVQRQVHHAPGKSPHQLAHVGVPLEMQASERTRAGPALVRLNDGDTPEEPGLRVLVEISSPVGLGEIASGIAKPAEADHPQIRNRKRFDFEYLHGVAVPSPGMEGHIFPGRLARVNRGDSHCLGSVKMSYLNGSVNLSSPQRFVVRMRAYTKKSWSWLWACGQPVGLPKVLWAGPKGLSTAPACPQPSAVREGKLRYA